MMASLDVLIVFAMLMCTGILSASQSTTAGEAAADDDEIALEEYVDNELPNFSGDVSSAIFGDTTGYDVHIEVKIANRSKTKENKNENINEGGETTTHNVSPKNRMKAKRILDLIIEKLKHKKEIKGKIGDSADVEIEDDGDIKFKTQIKHGKNAVNVANRVAGNAQRSKGDIVDSIEKKTDNKGNLPLKDQDMVSSPKIKDQDMVLPAKSKDQTKNQHTFNLPRTGKNDAKEESFSFKASNSQFMPKVSAITSPDESASVKNSKPSGISEKWKSSKSNKNIKIKVSSDEIRIKVPELLDKKALFSRIINIIEEDGKKAHDSKFVKIKQNSLNSVKQSLIDIESKLSKKTPPFYKFLLLKKLPKNTVVPQASPELKPGQSLTSDAAVNVEDTPPKKIATLPKESINEQEDIATTKLNPLKEKSIDNQDDIPRKGKESNVESQDEEPARKVENNMAPAQGELNDGKEGLGESVKPHENKEEVKMHESKASTNEHEFNDRTDAPKNEAFVPNNFASKAFQENLEPEEIGNKAVDVKQAEKKVLDIIPDELHIEDVDSDEKANNVVPQKVENKPSVAREHKLESTNSNSIIDGQKLIQMQTLTDIKHGETSGPKLNPGRLFNDSLFQQAGIESSDNIEGKHKIEKAQTSTPSPVGETNHFTKLPAQKKSEKDSHPVIDMLTFPEFRHEKSAIIMENKHEKTRNMVENKHDKMHSMVENRHKSHVTVDKHDKSHSMMENTHKVHNVIDDNHEKIENILEDKHEKIDATTNDKEGKPELITTEIMKPLNNPLPSILFKEILNTDDGLAKLSKKNKNMKKADNDVLEDDEVAMKKNEKFLEKENEEDGDNETAAPGQTPKTSVTIQHAQSSAKGNKLDLADLASLQLQSKDNFEIGSEEEEEGTGDDDEYEDASGDEEEGGEMTDNPDASNLSIANLAIWKASEDIHALLHSLTDREHADRVLGNLKNFIRDKHSDETKKRNTLDHKFNFRRVKDDYHFPDLNTKSIVSAMSKFPRILEVRKKSSIPEKLMYEQLINLLKTPDFSKAPNNSTINKRQSIHNAEPYLKREKSKRRRVEYDRYTNRTGQGIDRLYNQYAAANSVMPPTFADDKDGWSSDEIRNVMTQLKSTDIEENDMPPITSDVALTTEYQDIGVPAFTGYHRHPRIGLPQTNVHQTDGVPAKELIGYQKELRTQMLHNKVRNKLKFRKNDVSQLNVHSHKHNDGNKKIKQMFRSNHDDRNQANYMYNDGRNGIQQKSQLAHPYNSSVQFGNGDYIEGTPDYNLNKNNLWWDRAWWQGASARADSK